MLNNKTNAKQTAFHISLIPLFHRNIEIQNMNFEIK